MYSRGITCSSGSASDMNRRSHGELKREALAKRGRQVQCLRAQDSRQHLDGDHGTPCRNELAEVLGVLKFGAQRQPLAGHSVRDHSAILSRSHWTAANWKK